MLSTDGTNIIFKILIQTVANRWHTLYIQNSYLTSGSEILGNKHGLHLKLYRVQICDGKCKIKGGKEIIQGSEGSAYTAM